MNTDGISGPTISVLTVQLAHNHRTCGSVH